jgi:hypothetical protein
LNAAQAIGWIVRPELVTLPVRAEEELGFEPVPLDAPAGEDLRAPFADDHAIAQTGRVLVDSAREQELQQHAVVVEIHSVRRAARHRRKRRCARDRGRKTG